MKKATGFLLSLICLSASLTTISAESTVQTHDKATHFSTVQNAPLNNTSPIIGYYEANGQVIIPESDGNFNSARAVTPRYNYLVFVTAGSRAEGSTFVGLGTTAMRDSDKDTTMTVSVQKKKQGASSWSTAKTWPSDTMSGDETMAVEVEYKMTSGYDYRLKVYVVAKSQQDGSVVEKVTLYSPSQSY